MTKTVHISMLHGVVVTISTSFMGQEFFLKIFSTILCIFFIKLNGHFHQNWHNTILGTTKRPNLKSRSRTHKDSQNSMWWAYEVGFFADHFHSVCKRAYYICLGIWFLRLQSTCRYQDIYYRRCLRPNT